MDVVSCALGCRSDTEVESGERCWAVERATGCVGSMVSVFKVSLESAVLAPNIGYIEKSPLFIPTASCIAQAAPSKVISTTFETMIAYDLPSYVLNFTAFLRPQRPLLVLLTSGFRRTSPSTSPHPP